jgi:DNA-binding NtrC family response regulator
VLVVEDDPLMRLFVVRALQGAGYDTRDVESAERALSLMQTDAASICLLLSDVRLPGASGAELAEWARSVVPDLPTLLMSGSGRHALVNDRLIARDADVLQKPFRIAELLGKLEQLLAPSNGVAASHS